jgi:hypothetical protein
MYRIAHVISMLPTTMRGTLGSDTVTYWPRDAAVDASWRPPDATLASAPTSAPRATATRTIESPPPTGTRRLLGDGPPVSAVVAHVGAPPDCARIRQGPSTDATATDCLIEGQPVKILDPVSSSSGAYNWYRVEALGRGHEGKTGWVADAFLLLSAQTLLIGRSDTSAVTTLSIDTIDIPPGSSGDIILQMSLLNITSAPINWESDVGDTDIYLLDAAGNRLPSEEVGGEFARDRREGVRPQERLFGWHRFRLRDRAYRGVLTLSYPNHQPIVFEFQP